MSDAQQLMLRFFGLFPNDRSLADDRLRAVKAGEYQAALGHYPAAKVMEAASEAIRECEWTPTIAKLTELLRAKFREQRPYERWCDDERKYCGKNWSSCCGAPLTPAEQAKRAEFLAKMRQAYPSVFAKDGPRKISDGDIERPYTEAEVESAKRLVAMTKSSTRAA